MEKACPIVHYLDEASAIIDGLTKGGVGVWRWHIGTGQLDWTSNLESIHGLPPGSFTGHISSFSKDIHPDDARAVWEAITSSAETGAPYRVTYRTRPSESRQVKWIEAIGGLTVEEEETRYMTGICQDVTSKKQAEELIKRRALQQDGIARLGTFALSETDLGKVLDRAVEVVSEIFDVPMVKVLQLTDEADCLMLRAGVGWKKGLVGAATVGVDRTSQAGFTILTNGPVIVHDLLTESRFKGPNLLLDHGVRSGMSLVIPGRKNRPFGVFGLHSTTIRTFDELDVEAFQSIVNIVASAIRAAEAEVDRSLVMREVAHRSGNLLQMVSAIANQTFRDDRPVQEAQKAFLERMSSLSRASQLIARDAWKPTRLIAILEESLQPFAEQYRLDGLDIKIPSELAFDLGMIMHELATNSAKYGSLRSKDGQVDIGWAMHRDNAGKRQLEIAWTDPISTYESTSPGGGFGSTLKKSLVERKWGGTMTVERGGKSYKFICSIPLD